MRMLGCTRCGTPVPECLCELSQSLLFGFGQWSGTVTVSLDQPMRTLYLSVWLEAGSNAVLALATRNCHQIADHAWRPAES